ncbi:MAG: fibronectin type III domain-containing protein [Elusimicrobiota bacterium]
MQVLLQWITTYNNSSNSADYGKGISVDGSGNVYVTGFEDRFDLAQSYNIWVRKYDTNGLVQWTTTYNGTANGQDSGYGIATDGSGNVYVTGCSYETVSGFNIWVRKYDTNGLVQWTTTYKDTANGWDSGYGIATDASGNVYVTGCSYETVSGYNIWVRKYLQVPNAPTEFTGIPISTSIINWLWADNSNDELGFCIKTSTGGTIAILPANTTFWTEQNLQANTQYSRYVAAYNASGESEPSNSSSKYTLVANPPTGLSISNVTNSSIVISWTGNGASEFKVERSQTGGSPWTTTTDYFPATNFTDTTLSQATTYWFRVWGYNGDNIITTQASNIISTVTLNIASPSNFSGTAISSTNINWYWQDNANNETGYYLHSQTHSVLQSLSANTTFYIETGLSPNTQYPRHINVYNTGGSADSNSATVYTLAQPPSNLTSTEQINYTISLSWTSPAGTATRFSIEHASDSNGIPAGWTTIKFWADNISTTTYMDTGLNYNTKYWYRVKSYNTDGVINNSPSNQISVATSEDTTPPSQPAEITISPPAGKQTIAPGEPLTIAAKAEAGSSIYEIVIKDQNGNKLTTGIDTSGVTIDANGNLNGSMTLGDLVKNYPFATRMKFGC